jgi:nucleoside-diphosphate-sugar epimerase
MRVFVAGASGAIGRPLVPRLIAAGHEVTGTTRSEGSAEAIRAAGAGAAIVDALDADALREAVERAAPEVVVHELTALPERFNPRKRSLYDATNRIRREGTRNLLGAAAAAGASQVVVQSIAWAAPGGTGAVQEMEEAVLAAGGVVLRYGQFYGPGTFYQDEPPDPPRIEIDAAARRTLDTLTLPSGVVTIVDEC